MNAPPATTDDGGRRRLALSVGVGFTTALIMSAAASGLGGAWDEVNNYWQAVDHLLAWFALLSEQGFSEAFKPEALAQGWNASPYHNPHPPLPKLLVAIGLGLTPEDAPVFLRHRVALVAVFAATTAVVFHVVHRCAGPLAATAAVLAFYAQPRVLAHAVILAHDGTLACWMLLALLAASEMARDDTRPLPRLALALAVAAALLTKVTAALLALPLVILAVVFRRPRILLYAAAGATAGVVAMQIVHPPWLLLEQAIHHSAPFLHNKTFGTFYVDGPWWWLTAVAFVVPPLGFAVLHIPGAIAVASAARRRDPLAVALGGALVCWALVFQLPSTPRHDGIRQAVFWFVGAGVAWGAFLPGALATWAAALATRRPSLAPLVPRAPALVLVSLLAGTFSTLGAYPYWLESYSEGIGGLRGAYARGFEATYWLDTITPAVLDELNDNLPPGASLYEPYAETTVQALQRRGLLRADIVASDHAEWVLLQNRQTAWRDPYGELVKLTPTRTWVVDGVEVLRLLRVPPPLRSRLADPRPERRLPGFESAPRPAGAFVMPAQPDDPRPASP